MNRSLTPPWQDGLAFLPSSLLPSEVTIALAHGLSTVSDRVHPAFQTLADIPVLLETDRAEKTTIRKAKPAKPKRLPVYGGPY